TKVLWAALAVACYAGNDLYAKDIPKAESSMSQSQEQIRIQGRILDQSTNEPIAGVSIRLNGRTLASSNADGTFQLNIPKGSSVTFEFIGYELVSRTFNVNMNNAVIQMSESAEQISEVIVTALGIRRDQKALGYAATELKGEQLTDAISNNWTDALSGKVAGVNLVRS